MIRTIAIAAAFFVSTAVSLPISSVVSNSSPSLLSSSSSCCPTGDAVPSFTDIKLASRSTRSTPKCQPTGVSDDFACRDKLVEFDKNCGVGSTWGPQPNTYPVPKLPAKYQTSEAAAWERERTLAAIEHTVAMKVNYCHHHTPHWVQPESGPKPFDICQSSIIGAPSSSPSSSSELEVTGSDAGCSNALTLRMGIDCTTYTSWVYNFAFGAPLVKDTGEQACGDKAPGVALPYTASDIETQGNSILFPGDILYIASNGKATPLTITHGIFWTGIIAAPSGSDSPYAIDRLLANVPSCQSTAAKSYVNARQDAGLPIYVISDSHYNGPNYRPFAGWYVTAFTFARRIITTASDASFTTQLDGASYDGSSCLFTRNTDESDSNDA